MSYCTVCTSKAETRLSPCEKKKSTPQRIVYRCFQRPGKGGYDHSRDLRLRCTCSLHLDFCVMEGVNSGTKSNESLMLALVSGLGVLGCRHDEE